ncbi:UDP-4-amino-4,6-dideoxy-N-acetyl-beta-L-altrosamine transaminase [Alteromonas mediterranea]|uniref:UDP-4-amino-4, 6-dideoxy-N-acetyl-beta-L-altrosamine transaminase n=1 Tax=Alteromonas mediterranea TaxID=314275 RepID=UPI0009033287|nr:UDP-4-amino-4,6-dideoxy-N-acetyl-beta-L-altrosamine transaminase [Alteromonas mediterranea]APD93350.1 UDP-4-amino-4,6-dideoxy-N-acetyl-beta-L-altrosamine transaminase [Alteromonas mediterranea]APD96974.1 UDP-4-amino-4,6-dideoxy-N-acetyl-beta-L-altrosamine transaminase [Alteromonas mediterranea]QGX61044.1 UDP-4-amino-4,6-dideoxy-N-acetyl-beta-L-altrosamine transaminase [Alteromonas mediterranea]
MIPYGRQDIDDADVDAVVKTLTSDWLTQGPRVPAFESALASYCDAKFGIAVNSATSALHIACLALGVGAGDRVWTSPNSFVASANCALYCSASVDFVDIDINTGNMCIDALTDKLVEAERKNCLPKVIIPVHFAGQSCDMAQIAKLAEQYQFKVIEDASHAVGSKYAGSTVGNCKYSDICVFSFHPVKIITTMEGGMAMTNQQALADKMRLLRSHGVSNDRCVMRNKAHGPWYYEQVGLGFNYRMNDIEAALGISQLTKLDDFIAKRNSVAARYNEWFAENKAITPLVVDEAAYSSFHLYVVRIPELTQQQQSKLVETLREKGIFAHLHYIPIHTQPYYTDLGFKASDFPNAERYYSQAITLPIFPKLTTSQIDFIADTLISSVNSLKR